MTQSDLERAFLTAWRRFATDALDPVAEYKRRRDERT